MTRILSRFNLLTIAAMTIATNLVYFQSDAAHAVNLVANGDFVSFDPVTKAPNAWGSVNTVVSPVGNPSVNVANLSFNRYLQISV